MQRICGKDYYGIDVITWYEIDIILVIMECGVIPRIGVIGSCQIWRI